jgi:hypothetical protein
VADDGFLVRGGDDTDDRHRGPSAEIEASIHAEVPVDGATVVETQQPPLAHGVDLDQRGSHQLEVRDSRIAGERLVQRCPRNRPEMASARRRAVSPSGMAPVCPAMTISNPV